MWVHPLMSNPMEVEPVICTCGEGEDDVCDTPKVCAVIDKAKVDATLASVGTDDWFWGSKPDERRPLVKMSGLSLEALKLHALEKMRESAARVSLLWDIEKEQRVREHALLAGELVELYKTGWVRE